MREKMRWPPSRKQALLTVLGVSVLVSVVVGLSAGPLAGITLLIGSSGVLSLTLIFFPARPQVVAHLRGAENSATGTGNVGLVVGDNQVVRPLDVDQIVRAAEEEARATMPRRPSPRVPPGKFGGVFDFNLCAADMLASVSGASDDELRDFLGKVKDYGDELRSWLNELEVARRENLRPFTASTRAVEQGQAPADFARIRLFFPGDFEEPAPPPEVPAPPTRPKFVSRYGPPLLGPRLPRMPVLPIQSTGALSRLVPRQDKAEYSREDGETIVDMNLGHINQHDHRDSPEFSLRAAPPGTYEVRWRISANSLTPPTEGSLGVAVREPTFGEPITKLEDAVEEREARGLD